MQKEEESVDTLMCLSFSTYSHDKLGDIAERVTRDNFGAQNDTVFEANEDEEENDFEFVAFHKAADGVLVDGDARLAFPIFNRQLATAKECENGGEEVRFRMRKLLIGDEEHRREPEEEEVENENELEAIPEGTYCVWTPNSVQASPSRCKKNNSTGTTKGKRWKLLDLLRRSNSDGKDSSSLVFLTPSSSSSSSFGSNSTTKEAKEKKKKGVKGDSSKEKFGSGSAEGRTGRVAGKKIPESENGGGMKVLYVRNREMRKLDKRRTYLPYRQDLFGLFSFLTLKDDNKLSF